MLSILSGHRRYSHVTTIRCDGVNPGLLRMNKAIRRFYNAILERLFAPYNPGDRANRKRF